MLSWLPALQARGKGTWIARVYDEDASRYQVKSLGDFGTLPGNEMFAAAKKEAEKLAELVESGGEIRAKIETVADACREYAKDRPEADSASSVTSMRMQSPR